MRLPVRRSGRLAFLAFSVAVAAATAANAQQPELQGGGLAPAPPQITRVEATQAVGTTDHDSFATAETNGIDTGNVFLPRFPACFSNAANSSRLLP